MPRTLIQEIAVQIQREFHFRKDYGNKPTNDRIDDVSARLKALEDMLPSGSGIDSGTTIVVDKCTHAKIVLQTAFHHMNEVGYYDGWTEHTITIRPEFNGIDFTISGRDKNGIKDYLGEIFQHCLTHEIVDDSEKRPIDSGDYYQFVADKKPSVRIVSRRKQNMKTQFNDSADFCARMNTLPDCHNLAITIGGLSCEITIDENSLSIVCGNASLGLSATIIRTDRDCVFVKNISFDRCFN